MYDCWDSSRSVGGCFRRGKTFASAGLESGEGR